MTNLDPSEREKFAELAQHWWDPDGPCRTLHDINPCRADYICDSIDVAGLRIADIGCGGGLLSEALAARGAIVTGIDAAAELIASARRHATLSGLNITYEDVLSDQLAAREAASFDVVTCMELIEHVPDPAALLGDCATLLKPGGVLFVATLDRSPLSYAFGIVAAEYVLGLVERGTHDYARLVRPAELAALARNCGLAAEDISALHYNPLTRRARTGRTPHVNYLARFRRNDAPPH